MSVTLTTASGTRRVAWRRALGWLLLLSLLLCLLLAALGVAVWDQVAQPGGAAQGIAVTINGEDVTRALDISGWPPAHKLVLVALLALALLALLLVVPVAMLVASVALAVLVLFAVALPLMIGVAMVAAVTAPLWLLLWWLAVRARRARPAQAATIDA